MKRVYAVICGMVMLLCLGCAQCVLGQNGKPVVPAGARVAVVGDSITEQKLYSRNIELYLLACMPQLNTQVMQFGWSGERAAGFAARLNNDMLPFKPTVVTLCFGMNDGGYRAFTPEIGKSFGDPTLDIVKRCIAAGATVIVGSPGAVDSKCFRNDKEQAGVYNDNLGHLRDIAKQIATDTVQPFADVHEPMVTAMAAAKAALGDDYDVCGRDGVHPNANGHIIMAYAFLKAMGFDGNLGAITIDMAGAATAENGHKVLNVTGHKVELESTRYPFCFYGDGKSPGSTRSILPYLPFNQELNRLTLVVKNLKGDKATVTWGEATKTFTRAELEKGINLAAEFPDNPFSAPFQQLEAAIAAKQNYETFLIKSAITQFPNLDTQLGKDPEVGAALDVLRKKLWAKEDDFNTKVHAALTPVKHTISVDEVAQ